MGDKSKLTDAVEHAEACFWMAVAEMYPDIKTGDLAPEDTIPLRRAMDTAVRAWLSRNMPRGKAATASCQLTIEMRPPKTGERGWAVEALTADAALREVLRESEELGWVAKRDYSDEIDDDGMHVVTVVIGKPETLSATPLAELYNSQGFDLHRRAPVTPREVKRRELEQALTAREPYHGWHLDVMGHTGSWGYVHKDSQVTVFCTPDWTDTGSLAISCEADDGMPLPEADAGTETPYDVMTGTVAEFFALVRPWLDKHQPPAVTGDMMDFSTGDGPTATFRFTDGVSETINVPHSSKLASESWHVTKGG